MPACSIREEIVAVGRPLNFVGQMGTFCRSDGHFSWVGWALFVGRMGTFCRSAGHFLYRSDGHFS